MVRYCLLIMFLPAATKLGQGNKFTGVCLSTRGGCVPGLVPGGGVPGQVQEVYLADTPP